MCIATVDCWCIFSVIFGSLPSPSFFGYNGSFIALFDGWHGIPRCPVWWWRSCHWHHAMYTRICVHISVATILTQSPSPAKNKVSSHSCHLYPCCILFFTLCIFLHSHFQCHHCHLLGLLDFELVVLFMIEGWHLQINLGVEIQHLGICWCLAQFQQLFVSTLHKIFTWMKKWHSNLQLNSNRFQFFA